MTAAPFTFAYYRDILTVARRSYECCLFGDIFSAAAQGRSLLLVRHDIDLSLTHALKMAVLEHEAGVPATYYVMVGGPLYDVYAPENRSALRALLELGHEVGVHSLAGERGGSQNDDMPAAVRAECDCLERILGQPVKSISFHRPIPEVVRGDRFVADRVNAYAADLMQVYLADSGGRWRIPNPVAELAAPRAPITQLLVHPFWWGEQHAEPFERVSAFLSAQTRGWQADKVAAYTQRVAAVVPRAFESVTVAP